MAGLSVLGIQVRGCGTGGVYALSALPPHQNALPHPHLLFRSLLLSGSTGGGENRALFPVSVTGLCLRVDKYALKRANWPLAAPSGSFPFPCHSCLGSLHIFCRKARVLRRADLGHCLGYLLSQSSCSFIDQPLQSQSRTLKGRFLEMT